MYGIRQDWIKFHKIFYHTNSLLIQSPNIAQYEITKLNLQQILVMKCLFSLFIVPLLYLLLYVNSILRKLLSLEMLL